MNILVIGGAGYIGSHACKAIAQAGMVPIVVDNMLYGHREAVKWGPLEEGDILDSVWLDSVFERHKPSAVMHFAALTYVGESVTDPAKYYTNNVSGTISLLNAMRRAGVDTIIFSSTCATYGEVEKLPLDEETLQAPINPYGQTKLMNEQLLKDYGKAYGLRWAAMRYFNAAGADPDGEIGESHSPESHAIPLAIMAALGTGPEFRVFGDDYETPDGSALRDYIHVTDLADAHVKALTYLQNGGTSTAFNLGTGVPTSVFDIIAAIQAVAGKPVPYQKVERRLGDPAALYASPQKARTVLGWEPKHSHIDSIVNSAVRWHQNPAF